MSLSMRAYMISKKRATLSEFPQEDQERILEELRKIGLDGNGDRIKIVDNSETGGN